MESNETVICAAASSLPTGEKGNAINAGLQENAALHHCNIGGQVQHGGGSLGEKQPCWNKGTSWEHRSLMTGGKQVFQACVAGKTGPVDEIGMCGKTDH